MKKITSLETGCTLGEKVQIFDALRKRFPKATIKGDYPNDQSGVSFDIYFRDFKYKIFVSFPSVLDTNPNIIGIGWIHFAIDEEDNVEYCNNGEGATTFEGKFKSVRQIMLEVERCGGAIGRVLAKADTEWKKLNAAVPKNSEFRMPDEECARFEAAFYEVGPS